MAVHVTQGGDVAAGHASLRERLVAYKDLAKLDFYDVYLSVPLAWTLLGTPTDARAFVLLALMLVFNLGYLMAACALDDVQGIRDGIDTVNYDASATLRKRKRKPLVDDRLTERQALAFAWGSVLVAIVAGVAAFAVAGATPWWFVPLAATMMAIALGYSWGPKLSYVGGQELVIILGSALNLALMFAIVDGALTWTVVAEGVLLGCWLMQLTSFANVNDREGDRQAGRMTIPARLSVAGAQRFTAGLYVLGWVVLAAGLAAGVLPAWLLVLQLPVIAAQALALRAGIGRRDWLAARVACIRVYRLGWLSLVVANVAFVA